VTGKGEPDCMMVIPLRYQFASSRIRTARQAILLDPNRTNDEDVTGGKARKGRQVPTGR